MSLLRWLLGGLSSGGGVSAPPAVGIYFPVSYYPDGLYPPQYFTRPGVLVAPAFAIAIALDTNSFVGLPRSQA